MPRRPSIIKMGNATFASRHVHIMKTGSKPTARQFEILFLLLLLLPSSHQQIGPDQVSYLIHSVNHSLSLLIPLSHTFILSPYLFLSLSLSLYHRFIRSLRTHLQHLKVTSQQVILQHPCLPQKGQCQLQPVSPQIVLYTKVFSRYFLPHQPR